MKALRQVATLVALSLCSSTIVFADDQAVETIDDSKYFDGFYAGARIGVDSISARIHTGTESDSSFNYDALLGFRHQFANDWVLGMEGAIGDRTGDIKLGDHVFQFGKMWNVSATLGYSFGPNKDNLVYGKFGVGGIEVDVKAAGDLIGSQNFEGPVSTLGYERSLTERVSILAEVSYSSYDPDLDQWRPNLGVLVKF